MGPSRSCNPTRSSAQAGRGSACTAKQTRIFARRLGLKPCVTPVPSPQSNGMSEAFAKTLKRAHVRVNPRPDVETVPRLKGNGIENCNAHHTNGGLQWRSAREFIRARTETSRVPGEMGAGSQSVPPENKAIAWALENVRPDRVSPPPSSQRPKEPWSPLARPWFAERLRLGLSRRGDCRRVKFVPILGHSVPRARAERGWAISE